MADKTSGVEETAVRDELGRVLSSSEFTQSESLMRFLRHGVESTLDASLPVVSFASDPDFDPFRGDVCFTALLDAMGVR